MRLHLGVSGPTFALIPPIGANAMTSNPLRYCLHRLTHLSGRSRVLRLLRLPLKQCMDLHALDLMYPKRISFDIIAELIAHKPRITLAPFLAPGDADSNENSRKLWHILRSDRMMMEERGDRALAVGWPIVQGQFSDGYMVRCPLLFFSVDLQYTAHAWQLTLRGEAPITLNRAFVLGYCQHHALHVPSRIWDEDWTAYPRDARAFLTQLYRFLEESPIQMDFGVVHFEEQLTSFKPYRKTELEANTQCGHLGLHPCAVLGLFPQGNVSMIADCEYLMNLNLSDPFETLFSPKPVPDTPEKENIIPLPLDAAQEEAFGRVKEGRHWVVQGPPGTGKSQLITALVADAMANKKRVALVCQKRAALAVIYRRLQALGAADFVAYVCDVKHERATLYKSIHQQIERVDNYKQSGATAEMITLERNFKLLTRRLGELTDYLSNIQRALYDTSQCEKPVKVLYLRTQAAQKVCNFRTYYEKFPYSVVPDFLFRLRTYALYAARFQAHPLWQNRQSFASHSAQDLSQAVALIDELGELIDVRLPDLLKKATWNTPPTLATLVQGLGRQPDLLKLMHLLRHSSSFQRAFQSALTADWLGTPERKRYTKALQAMRRATHALEALPSETRYAHTELQDLQRILKRVQEIGQIGRLLALGWYHLWGTGRIKLRNALRAHDLSFDPNGCRQLRNILDCQAQWYEAQPQTGVERWPPAYEDAFPAHIKHALPEVTLALHMHALSFASPFKSLWHTPFLEGEALIAHLQNTNELLAHYTDLRTRSEAYFTPEQINQMLSSRAYRAEIKDSLMREFEDLCAFDRLYKDMRKVEKDVIKHLYAEVQAWDAERLTECFEQSLAHAWIHHIESAYPCLRDIGTLHFEEKVQAYRRLMAERRQLSARVLMLRLQERTYEDAQYTRYAGKSHLKDYRELRQQLRKKRRLWPMRRLMEQMGEEVFALMPCWLLTPEAASAIFSMNKHFDMLLFDEASQCFIEHALPAMYRARQLVIIGDSQQLPPNELYQSKWQDTDEETEDDLDAPASLLENADKYLQSTYLRGHYRSQQLDLIHFSNQHFYNHRLEMLPHFESVRNYTPSIRYINVAGIWENHINKEEAEKVVELVVECLKESSAYTIGVITFNLPQQECVWDTLARAHEVNKELLAADWGRVSVKNIENVQGDEFDVVIFSIGYAPGPDGGSIRRAFGSLSQPGGHKRLNVAITRAKLRMYVVCSIQPEALRIDDLDSEGGRMLGRYLAYAYEVSQGKFKPFISPIDTPLNERLSHALAEDAKQQAPKHQLIPFLPYADLTYMEDQKPSGLVFTDDKPYYELRTAADIYVHRPLQLSMRGWPYVQMHSRTYWMNKAHFLDEMWKHLNGNK